jgi:hypothetical protein
MSKHKTYECGDTGLQYLCNCLQGGNQLARYLLNETDLSKGKLFTHEPPKTDEDCLERYRYGGIASAEYSIDYLISEIQEHLERDCGQMVVFEDNLQRKDDPHINKSGTRMFFYHEQIYHYLMGEDLQQPEQIEWTITESASLHLFIGVMTSSSQDPKLFAPRSNASDATLKDLAQNSKKIIVGAYDGEGYLIWEKTEKKRGRREQKRGQTCPVETPLMLTQS